VVFLKNLQKFLIFTYKIKKLNKFLHNNFNFLYILARHDSYNYLLVSIPIS